MTDTMSRAKNAENTRKRSIWRSLGIGCLVAAGSMVLIWWPLFAKRTQDWHTDPPEAPFIRIIVMALVLGGGAILAILSRRRF